MEARIERDEWLCVKQRIDADLVGQEAWSVSLGHGSFVTMEFGAPLPPDPEGTVHGEWMLWVYMCSWKAVDGDESIDSEASRADMASWVKRFNGKKLVAFEFDFSSSKAVLRFDGGELQLASYDSPDEDDETWMLFMPDHMVLTAMSAGGWQLEDSGRAVWATPRDPCEEVIGSQQEKLEQPQYLHLNSDEDDQDP
jgi:hypothetical protein